MTRKPVSAEHYRCNFSTFNGSGSVCACGYELGVNPDADETTDRFIAHLRDVGIFVRRAVSGDGEQ